MFLSRTQVTGLFGLKWDVFETLGPGSLNWKETETKKVDILQLFLTSMKYPTNTFSLLFYIHYTNVFTDNTLSKIKTYLSESKFGPTIIICPTKRIHCTNTRDLGPSDLILGSRRCTLYILEFIQ